MALRNPNTIQVSRQAITLLIGLGTGFLVLSYLLGVQVGKQSAAMRKTAGRSIEEELKELPQPLPDQLKVFETPETKAGTPEESHPPETPPTASATIPPTTEPKPADETQLYIVQILSTTDPEEVKRVVARLKAADFETVVIQDKDMHKIRLAKPVPKAKLEPTSNRLKALGLRPFTFKAPPN